MTGDPAPPVYTVVELDSGYAVLDPWRGEVLLWTEHLAYAIDAVVFYGWLVPAGAPNPPWFGRVRWRLTDKGLAALSGRPR